LAPAGKRGPKTALSDAALLELIQADLKASPFQGEGHRKVWARLRVRDGVKVGRRRVLRLMRENNLLSPYRGRRGNANPHEGTIVTQAPNLMWGTDGARIFTVDEGWVWTFVAVEHWNAECVGWHACKQGTRFAALEPISQALMSTVGSVAADAGRGLSVRMDHGTQYLSDHFQHQLKFWGISPSFAFIEQPQTNGVAERFIKTLKEQVIYGRVFRNLEEVREAVRRFVDQYNHEWLVEKNGFLSPWQARDQWLAQASLARAA
jgi:transposase InsO family protein